MRAEDDQIGLELAGMVRNRRRHIPLGVGVGVAFDRDPLIGKTGGDRREIGIRLPGTRQMSLTMDPRWRVPFEHVQQGDVGGEFGRQVGRRRQRCLG